MLDDMRYLINENLLTPLIQDELNDSLNFSASFVYFDCSREIAIRQVSFAGGPQVLVIREVYGGNDCQYIEGVISLGYSLLP